MGRSQKALARIALPRPDEQLRELGSLCVAPACDEAALRAEFAHLVRYGCHGVELWDARRVQSVVGCGGFVAGIFFPHDAIIDSQAYSAGLLRLAADVSAGGVVLLERAPPAVRVRSFDDFAVTTFADGTSVRSRHVVVATGGLFVEEGIAGVLTPTYSYLVALRRDDGCSSGIDVPTEVPHSPGVGVAAAALASPAASAVGVGSRADVAVSGGTVAAVAAVAVSDTAPPRAHHSEDVEDAPVDAQDAGAARSTGSAAVRDATSLVRSSGVVAALAATTTASAPPPPPLPFETPNIYTYGFSHDWAFVQGVMRLSGEDGFSALKPPRAKLRCDELVRWAQQRYPELTTVTATQYGVLSDTPDYVPLVGTPNPASRVCYLLGCNAAGQAVFSYAAAMVPGILGYAELTAEQRAVLSTFTVRRFALLPSVQQQQQQGRCSGLSAKL